MRPEGPVFPGAWDAWHGCSHRFKLRSSARPIHTLNHWTIISTASNFTYSQDLFIFIIHCWYFTTLSIKIYNINNLWKPSPYPTQGLWLLGDWWLVRYKTESQYSRSVTQFFTKVNWRWKYITRQELKFRTQMCNKMKASVKIFCKT